MKRVDEYEIISLLGQGGMGKVYKARHYKSGKPRVIKQLLLDETSTLTKRFIREAEVMIKLKHPNIARVFKHFKEGTTHFFAMEFIDGIDLGQLIERKKRIEHKPTLLIFLEICKGLCFAHQNGIIHRDIKPDNILIAKSGAIKLLDFGLATAPPGCNEALTKAGTVMGTPAYMSPEQIKSTKDVEVRSDIYSMGVLLYEMLTGTLPFAPNFDHENLINIDKGKYINIHKVNPELPKYIKKIIKKTMNANKNKRYPDLEKLISVLSKHIEVQDKIEKNNIIAKYVFGKIYVRKPVKPVKSTGKDDDIIKIKFKDPTTARKFTIGRDPRNHIVLSKDTTISGKHALLEKGNGKIHLTDLKSTNGTLINGKRVKCEVKIEIRFGDIITFGKTRLKLVK